jgi:hypothetical protein
MGHVAHHPDPLGARLHVLDHQLAQPLDRPRRPGVLAVAQIADALDVAEGAADHVAVVAVEGHDRRLAGLHPTRQERHGHGQQLLV